MPKRIDVLSKIRTRNAQAGAMSSWKGVQL
jgi:hypothetical protein